MRIWRWEITVQPTKERRLERWDRMWREKEQEKKRVLADMLDRWQKEP